MGFGKVAINRAGNFIKGMGPRASRYMGTAREYGDKLLANKVATYSTIAAGGVVAGALYADDHPVFGTMALAATGGLGLMAASRGHFGGAAQGYANRGIAGGRNLVSKGNAWGQDMRNRMNMRGPHGPAGIDQMAMGGPRGPNNAWRPRMKGENVPPRMRARGTFGPGY